MVLKNCTFTKHLLPNYPSEIKCLTYPIKSETSDSCSNDVLTYNKVINDSRIMLYFTGPGPENIVQAKQLIEDTIRYV